MVSGNRVSGGDSAGIYVGSSPQARTRVFGNRVTAAGLFDIYIRNASHGAAAGNTVDGACIGVGFIATAPARDTVSDWQATGNRLRRNNRVCQVGATLTGTGVLLGGTDRISIAHNVVSDNVVPPGTSVPWGGGIVLVGGSLFGGPAESVGTRITGNLLYGNRPFDITILGPRVVLDMAAQLLPDRGAGRVAHRPGAQQNKSMAMLWARRKTAIPPAGT